MNTTYTQLIVLLFMCIMTCQTRGQTTAIPDTAFEKKLIALAIDTDGLVNGQILTSDAAARTTLYVNNSNIHSLEGIEAFTSLSTLNCENNNLTALDLTQNSNLSELHCANNNLIELDLTQNLNLVNLYANNNNLQILKIASSYIGIFHCRNNKLSHLDMSSAGNSIYSFETLGNLAWLRICLADINTPNLQNWLYDSGTLFTDECYIKAVEGRVFVDDNNNCILDTLEAGLQGQIVEFDKRGQKRYFSTVDSFGNYEAYLDTGTYTMTVLSSSNYWQGCQTPQLITVDTTMVQTVNWGLRAAILCPLMEVDLSAPFLRQTNGGSSYQINYCNQGTVTAGNAYVEVNIDPDLHVLNTSIPITNQSGSIYTFNLGDVPAGRCGGFTIQVLVDSSALVGQTYCTEAHVYPDSICGNSWQGADMDVASQCNSDSIWFTITNNGTTMASPSTYYVFEDNIMMRQNPFQLGAGGSVNVVQPVIQGRTYRINVDQMSGYPSILGDPFVTTAREDCAPLPDGSFNRGFITQFSNGNSSPFIAVDCQQSRAAYDPNDKAAQPEGYGSAHHIENYIDLDYKIRFQNTGTDTAFNVVILDTLSAYLNIGSLTMGASSHPYTWTIQDGNVLKVSFANIMLPDSNVNEPLSHGFFRYRIEQAPSNPIGTVINNSAAIYFDFNAPIITNTTWHTIGANFFDIDVSVDKVLDEQIDVLVYPNPFNQVTTIEVKGKEYETLELQVFDVTGRAVDATRDYQKNRIQLSRGQLQPGIYLYQLVGDDQLINTGKIIVQ